MNPPPNLCFTVTLDRPGTDVHRRMARLLVTSLVKTGWHGRIVVFRNQSQPVLPEGHPDVEEQVLETGPDETWAEMLNWKYRAAQRLDLTGIGKVLFLDSDIIALRSINHLMAGSWDIYTAAEPGRMVEFPFNGYLTEEEMVTLSEEPGINSGSIGMKASVFRGMMVEWQRIHRRQPLRPYKTQDQQAWNRLMLDTRLRRRHFQRGEVQFPFLHHASYLDYRRAALVHAADRSPEEKFSLLYGLWMEVFGKEHFEEFTAS